MSLISHSLMTLHIGQAGVQIGHAIWELMCLEHNIGYDGLFKQHCGDLGNVEAIFEPASSGRYFPRALFVDTDPSCIVEMRSGIYQDLFCGHQMLSEHTDAANNFVNGHYGYTKTLLPEMVDRLRWMFERLECKPTIFLVHSSCGGTGSGFTAASLTRMANDFGVKQESLIDLCVVPGLTAAQSSCELLNTALYLDESRELTSQTFCVSNSAMFNLCNAQLQSNGAATFVHTNRALAAVFSNMTATERLARSSVTLKSVLEGLQPFPNLRYAMLSCAPFLSWQAKRLGAPSAKATVKAVIEPSSQFLDVDLRTGLHTAGFMLFRGGISLSEADAMATDLLQQGRVQFQDWAPIGFMTGVVPEPPLAPPGSGFADPEVSVTLLSSHSSISSSFSKLAADTETLLERDYFIHNYEAAVGAILKKQNPTTPAAATAKASPTAKHSSYGADRKNRLVQNMASSQYYTVEDSRISAELLANPRRLHTAKRHGDTEQNYAEHNQQATDKSRVLRTSSLGDDFDVRIRLSWAIAHLQHVSKFYDSTDASQNKPLTDPALSVDHKTSTAKQKSSKSNLCPKVQLSKKRTQQKKHKNQESASNHNTDDWLIGNWLTESQHAAALQFDVSLENAVIMDVNAEPETDNNANAGHRISADMFKIDLCDWARDRCKGKFESWASDGNQPGVTERPKSWHPAIVEAARILKCHRGLHGEM